MRDAAKRAGPPRHSLRSDTEDEAKFEVWLMANCRLMTKKARVRTYQKFKAALGAVGRWMIDESNRSGRPMNIGYKEAGVSPDGQLWKNYQRDKIP